MRSFLWAGNYRILSQSKENLEQMMKELVNEGSKWDMESKPTCLWVDTNICGGGTEEPGD